jgi:hypothetical protein
MRWLEVCQNKLGNTTNIAGGISNLWFTLMQPQDLQKKYCELIGVCGKDGGFILANEGMGNIDRGKQENVHAMIEVAEEYRP